MAGTAIRLMGAHEVRMRLGKITRQRVYQLTTRADFPAPVGDLMQGKVWLAVDVERWVASRPARKGTRDPGPLSRPDPASPPGGDHECRGPHC